MLGPEELEFIARVPIFGAMPVEALAKLGELARRVDCDPGAVLFKEGEPAREMVVVMRGELEVRKMGRDGGDARIATLHGGDVAGEMALIDIQPRSAGVRALTAASLVVLTHSDLATLYRDHTDGYVILVMNIAREISRRLRRVDEILATLLLEVQDVWSGAVTAAAGGGRAALSFGTYPAPATEGALAPGTTIAETGRGGIR